MSRTPTDASTRAVTFIVPGGEMTIRMMQNDTDSMVKAAKTLKARYFVAADGYDQASCQTMWGVFDTKGLEKSPDGRQWSLRDPIKVFTDWAPDAAVMYALAISGRG